MILNSIQTPFGPRTREIRIHNPLIADAGRYAMARAAIPCLRPVLARAKALRSAQPAIAAWGANCRRRVGQSQGGAHPYQALILPEPPSRRQPSSITVGGL